MKMISYFIQSLFSEDNPLTVFGDQVKKNCIGIHSLMKNKKTFKPLPDDKILDWSKLKQIADDI